MKFNILVINLDSNPERLQSIEKQCQEYGLNFTRIPAVRGSSLSQAERDAVYNEEDNRKYYYKVLTSGEIGCTLSHVHCWQFIIENDLDYALILEDDAIFTPHLTATLNALATLAATDWDYIKLSHGSRIKSYPSAQALGNGISLTSVNKLPSTTTGQFVSQAGAKKLLESAFPIVRPIDIDLQFWYEKNLRCYTIRPFPILNGDFGSEINKQTDRTKRQADAWKKFSLRIAYEWGLWKHRYQRAPLPLTRTAD